mgnify:CR=1 FL=1
MIKEYLESIQKRDPAAKSKLSILVTYPGVKALFFHRIAIFFCIAKFDLLAKMISQLSRFFTGIEIHPKAKIGKNFFSHLLISLFHNSKCPPQSSFQFLFK